MEAARSKLSQLESELAASHRNVAALSQELEQANESLERLSFYDRLTGLPNRALFHEQLDRWIALARREKRSFPVLLLDFNRFKEINDTLGFEVGDRVLCEIADRMTGSLRDSDLAARLGADEFAVVLPTTVSVEGAETVARKIIEAVEAPFDVEGHHLLMGVSIGIALYPDHGADNREMLRHADRGMSEAKLSGGGFVAYGPPGAAQAKGRVLLAGDMREAIQNDELVLHFQPKVEIATGRVIGGEALVRWQHPSDGLIFPDEFIPVVEKTGVIDLLTDKVMEGALAWASSWRTAGQPLSVAVNLSPRSLHDAELPQRVSAVLERYDLPPEALVLEITESAIMIDTDRAMAVVTRLVEQGVAIAIDDFGTGYSSLAYLRRLPACEIKIDKSFVMGMDTNSDDATIVRSVIDLGKNLGKRLVAEGIETAEVWRLLGEMGCDAGQGYYISRPVPEAAFRDWLTGPIWRP